MPNENRKTSCLFKRAITIITLLLCLLLSFTFYMKKRPHTSNGAISGEGPVDNFVLMDHQGVFHELYNYTDQKVIVLVSQANGCATNRLMAPYLNDLKEKYESKGVKFLMINASLRDDRMAIVKEVEEYNISIPVLKDEAQVISADLKIQQAGEAIVLNPANWFIVYRGAIANQMSSETDENEIQEQYIQNAINALLEGTPLVVSKTQFEGCMVDMRMVSSQEEISFVSDVAPILIKRCLVCHNEGRMDTWAMSDYETVASWSSIIRDTTKTKRMPPWKGDESLSPDEIRKLVQWVEQGAHRGEGIDPLKDYTNNN